MTHGVAVYPIFFNHLRNQALGGGLHVWVSIRSPSPSSARHNTYYFHVFSIFIYFYTYVTIFQPFLIRPCMPLVSSELIFPPTSTSASALSLLRLRKAPCSWGENSASAGNVFSNLATSLSFLCTTCAHETHRLWRCEWWLTKEMMNNEANPMILKHWESINWCDSSPNYIQKKSIPRSITFFFRK